MTTTITAKAIGNPAGGQLRDPWPSGGPVEGERVAIFAFDVTSVDGEAEELRTFHVAPIGPAEGGTPDPDRAEPQGITVHWTNCGAGTVVRRPEPHDLERRCEVRPDDPRSVATG